MSAPQKRPRFRRLLSVLALAALLTAAAAPGAQAFSQSDEYLGTVALFAGNFTPRNWLPCDGRLLPISQYQALFAVMECQYGGDCRNSFALPDLRGRVPLGSGIGPGLTPRQQGQRGGSETVISAGSGGSLHTGNTGDQHYIMDNMPPFASLQYIICVNGLWPPRD